MRKAGAKDYKVYSKKFLKSVNKPVSLEVFGDDNRTMLNQALQINSWGKNSARKNTCDKFKGKFTGKVIKYLSQKYKLNITAVYTAKNKENFREFKH